MYFWTFWTIVNINLQIPNGNLSETLQPIFFFLNFQSNKWLKEHLGAKNKGLFQRKSYGNYLMTPNAILFQSPLSHC